MFKVEAPVSVCACEELWRVPSQALYCAVRDDVARASRRMAVCMYLVWPLTPYTSSCNLMRASVASRCHVCNAARRCAPHLGTWRREFGGSTPTLGRDAALHLAQTPAARGGGDTGCGLPPLDTAPLQKARAYC